MERWLIVRNLINKFLKRNEKIIDSNNVILDMNGIVLLKSCDKDFEFKTTAVEEVRRFCSEHDINRIDKVVIMSVYDADLHNRKSKFVFEQRTVSKSENKIIVIEENGQRIAQVFFSEYVEIQENI